MGFSHLPNSDVQTRGPLLLRIAIPLGTLDAALLPSAKSDDPAEQVVVVGPTSHIRFRHRPLRRYQRAPSLLLSFRPFKSPTTITITNNLMADEPGCRTRTRTNTHPNDTKNQCCGLKCARVLSAQVKSSALPIGGGGAGIKRRNGRWLRGHPVVGVSVWFGHSAGQPEVGQELCWHGPH